MKSKRNIYFLLPVVLLIWGLVIYRIAGLKSPEIKESSIEKSVFLKPLSVSKPRDTLRLTIDYRDPFLGKVYLKKKDNVNGERKKKQQKASIQWPHIVFRGIVSDNKEKRKVFMVIINGKTYLMREKETIDDITLLYGNRKSIEVKFKGDLTTIMLPE